MKGRRDRAWSALSALAIAAVGCSEPDYGELPARCSEGACPEGYDCIHGVCAAPGTKVPITVAELPYLRGMDLRVVPQTSTALVTWQTYAYSEGGERFMGARVRPDGEVSPPLTLVSSFEANEGAIEPFYDVLRTSDEQLLLAISAAPLAGDPAPEPRLVTYRVDLPAEGSEASGAHFVAAWKKEMRMPTVGYGAVSRPKLLAREKSGSAELGYVQARTANENGVAETIGELAVVPLNKDGSIRPAGPAYYRAREGLTVAVGVIDAFEGSTGAWWILDDARPTAVLISEGAPALEAKLDRLSIACSVEGTSLTYIQPSARTGEKLPSDPVSGPAVLHRLDHVTLGGDTPALVPSALGELPAMRDTPRPVWITRSGKPAIVVSPGSDLDAPSIGVYTVDPATGQTAPPLRIERFASSPIDALAAALVGGNLFVAWVDGGASTSTIRMAVMAEP